MLFFDRAEAGRRLAQALAHLKDEHVVVLGLPRGGVPVAFEVARALQAPLDVLVVRKLGLPFQPELAMGAIGEDGVRVVNEQVVRLAGIDDREFAAVEARERAELQRRARRFRGGRQRIPLTGQVAVIVDDGIATGSTARAACRVARLHGAASVVLATPVAPRRTVEELSADADEVICLGTPEPFHAIGEFYANFSQTSDDEVVDCLSRAHRVAEELPRAVAASPDPPPLIRDEQVVDARGVLLLGHLTMPPDALGIVVFAHGSGSSRHSPRNRFVASVLSAAGLGTLLFDLLTPDEELDRANVFDIELLAERLSGATEWLRQQPEAAEARGGYFGASTGAAAAL
jgi:putative phosphoribosyl transferase